MVHFVFYRHAVTAAFFIICRNVVSPRDSIMPLMNVIRRLMGRLAKSRNGAYPEGSVGWHLLGHLLQKTSASRIFYLAANAFGFLSRLPATPYRGTFRHNLGHLNRLLFLCAAQRLRCASAIRLRASADMTRLFGADFC
jgi:hypothetical protein